MSVTTVLTSWLKQRSHGKLSARKFRIQFFIHFLFFLVYTKMFPKIKKEKLQMEKFTTYGFFVLQNDCQIFFRISGDIYRYLEISIVQSIFSLEKCSSLVLLIR